MIKVISADISALTRSVEQQIFALNQDFKLLATVSDANSLIEKCKNLKPDLVLCSSDIPNLKNALKILFFDLKLKIILLKENSTKNKKFWGITEIEKPNLISMSPKDIKNFFCELKKNYTDSTKQEKMLPICELKQEKKNLQPKKSKFDILLIGVSTGGPKSIQILLDSLGKSFSLPILITQHIDTSFDKNMVSWLNRTVNIPTTLAKDGELLKSGCAYFAPAECHLTLKRVDEKVYIKLDKSEPINFLRPAVDKMFESASKVFGNGCLAVLLTGMGTDGTKGCKEIKKVGGYTIGESEETCVVFGMPKSAYDAGVIDEMLPLYEIGNKIKQLVAE